MKKTLENSKNTENTKNTKNNKNIRIIIFSVLGLVILGAVTALLYFTQPETPEENEEPTATTVDEKLIISEGDSTAVKSIHIVNQYDDFTLMRETKEDGTEKWSIQGRDIDDSLLNYGAFQNTGDYAVGITAKELTEENAADWSKYGLDDPTATVTVNKTDGSTLTFMLGDQSPTGNYTYFATTESRNVYLCYTYKVNTFFSYTSMSYIQNTVMPAYDNTEENEIEKLTVKRKDLDKDIVVEKLPEVPEDSDSIAVYSYAFTSPYSVYVDLSSAGEFIYALYGLTAQKAAYLENTDEIKDKTGLDDPFCEVDMLVGDVIYRLYIGDAITEEVTDETSGVTSTIITGYYGYCNQVPDVVYVFSPESVFWVDMDVTDYMSKIFLMPYIYDLKEVKYDDGETTFSLNIEGNGDENHFYLSDGTEVDGDRSREMYQYMVQARGETVYTDPEKGELLATYTYVYEDDREDSVVCYYSSPDGRSVIVNVDGQNVYKTKPMYVTRLKENAASFISGGEIIMNY